MSLTASSISAVFESISEANADYQEALNLVKQNCSGRIWLVGGFLYKSLVSEFYGKRKAVKDFDFLVENHESISLPFGWRVRKNRFGSEKFSDGTMEIDVIPIANVYWIKNKGMPESIESYLSHVPLNVHALAYEVFERKILGDAGIESLDSKVVRVNDMTSALEMVRQYPNRYTSVLDLVEKKAAELEFDFERI